ncbi:hypothetical protein [Acinetobacter pollinis]|uniref:hypothetical protein n=1 Tax=Acinetobacter pollinis TaxID=2605270 RepID=UPI0018A3006B|nr:hypothetical protein [Acinetobacter pollinis]MBF7691435.1 hypothetical protein [Acinetobacter pollinis]MBF7699130.1 hypothetical protein [Acinetobacter pollinis]
MKKIVVIDSKGNELQALASINSIDTTSLDDDERSTLEDIDFIIVNGEKIKPTLDGVLISENGTEYSLKQ